MASSSSGHTPTRPQHEDVIAAKAAKIGNGAINGVHNTPLNSAASPFSNASSLPPMMATNHSTPPHSTSSSSNVPPTYFDLPASNTYNFGRPGRGIGDYLRRIRYWAHMDWEYTIWQMVYICFQPKKVYNTTKYHKQTKNQWARDDPGFVVLLVALLTLASISWCIAFRSPSVIPKMILYVVFVDFLLLAVVVSTITWFLSNHFLIHSPSNPSSDAASQHLSSSSSSIHGRNQPPRFLVKQQVEWLYAFDVHCNSFFPSFLILHVIHFLLLPIILYSPSFISLLVANSLFLLAFSYYHYITCLGFTALPFLQNTHIFLFPIGVLIVLYLVAMLFGFNISLWIMAFYFPML